jgi:hypothetical protein
MEKEWLRIVWFQFQGNKTNGDRTNVLRYNLWKDYADTELQKLEINFNLNSILLKKIWRCILLIQSLIHIRI